jgi:hypothetical protein
MGLLARETLADCEVAHGLLKNEKKESVTWRPHWVLCGGLTSAEDRAKVIVFLESPTTN